MALGIGVAGFASYYSQFFAGRADDDLNCDVVAAAPVDSTDSELEALGRPTAGAFGESYDCPVYESLDELLEADAVDAVVLGTATSRRADDAVRVLEAGHPVLTGKPVSDSAEGAARVARAADSTGLLAATTTPHRFDGRIQEAASRVAAGAVGDVLSVRTSAVHKRAGEGNVAGHDTYAPGEAGVAYAMGFYTADLLRWFVGDRTPERVTGELENANSPYLPHPDMGSATVRYEDGTVGTMMISMANDHVPGNGWDVEVIGTEGTIWTGHGGHEGRQWSGDGTDAFGRTLTSGLGRQFDAFVEALAAGTESDPVEPAPVAVRDGMALVDAWVSAAESGGPVRPE